jgi:hypothetical protein
MVHVTRVDQCVAGCRYPKSRQESLGGLGTYTRQTGLTNIEAETAKGITGVWRMDQTVQAVRAITFLVASMKAFKVGEIHLSW